MNDILADFLGDWSKGFHIGGVLLKLGICVILSAIVGCERATKRHAAGLRTFMLVSFVSTLAAMVDRYVIEAIGAQISFAIGAVMIGLAIVSSNTLLYSSKSQLKGLTTSVALWGMSIISVLIGLDLYLSALIAFVAFLLCLTVFVKLEYVFKRRSDHFEIHLELKNKNSLQDFIATVRKLGMKVDNVELNTAYVNSGLCVYSIALSAIRKNVRKMKHEDIVAAISELEYVSFVEEMD